MTIGIAPSCLGFMMMSVLPFPASYSVLIEYLLVRPYITVIRISSYEFSCPRFM